MCCKQVRNFPRFPEQKQGQNTTCSGAASASLERIGPVCQGRDGGDQMELMMDFFSFCQPRVASVFASELWSDGIVVRDERSVILEEKVQQPGNSRVSSQQQEQTHSSPFTLWCRCGRGLEDLHAGTDLRASVAAAQ